MNHESQQEVLSSFFCISLSDYFSILPVGFYVHRRGDGEAVAS